ncbi:transporter [Emcibacter sp.]|uniref:transporter n=1 Tax=Emcibacter sp. TaxID=1979954 RepID=UPI002AA60BEA|nr:transporter [Emcibacter sp.]
MDRAEVTGFTILPGILIGNVTVRQANRDTLVPSLTTRYGITNRLEVEAKVPFVYRNDTTIGRPVGEPASADLLSSASGSDIGDVELALHYQINSGGGGWPFLVGNLRLKAPTGSDPFEVARDPVTGVELELPTGTGFWSVQPSLTAIFPSDPAVLFANLNYTWNMKRTIGGIYGVVDPGDSIGASLGLGLALNDKLSVSASYDHSIVMKTRQNGEYSPVASTLQLGTLLFGGSYRFSDKSSISLTIGTGITEDAPDLRVSIRYPYTF